MELQLATNNVELVLWVYSIKRGEKEVLRYFSDRDSALKVAVGNMGEEGIDGEVFKLTVKLTEGNRVYILSVVD